MQYGTRNQPRQWYIAIDGPFLINSDHPTFPLDQVERSQIEEVSRNKKTVAPVFRGGFGFDCLSQQILEPAFERRYNFSDSAFLCSRDHKLPVL
jgi:hypothetical protein